MVFHTHDFLILQKTYSGFWRIVFNRVVSYVSFQFPKDKVFNGMCSMTNFGWNIDIFIFSFLENRYIKFPSIFKTFTLEDNKIHKVSTVAIRKIIDCNGIAKQIKFSYPIFKIFLLPLVMPNPSSINLLNKIGKINFYLFFIFLAITFPV